MAVVGKVWSHFASGARNLFNLSSTIGEAASVGAQVSLFEAATRITDSAATTRTATSPSSTELSLRTDTASECVKFAILVALALGLSSFSSITQTSVCQHRAQPDSAVEARITDHDAQHQREMGRVESDHVKEMIRRDELAKDTNARHQRQIDDIRSQHSRELSRRDKQFTDAVTQHQQQINQLKSHHPTQISHVSIELKDERRLNKMNMSRISSLETQLKAKRDKDEEDMGPRKGLIMRGLMQKQNLRDTHTAEKKQMVDDHAAALKAQKLEFESRLEAKLTETINETEKRVKQEVKAELEAARAGEIETKNLRLQVDTHKRDASALKIRLRQAESSVQNHIDFRSDQREAESKAKIEILQTENKDLKKKVANATEALRVCNASKTGIEKQRCANESDLVSKVEVDLLKKKIREFEDLLKSAAVPCNGNCPASKAQYDELRAVIRNNRDVFERGKKHKNKQHREVTARLEGEKIALQKELKDLHMQFAEQQQPAKSQEQQSKLSPVYTIITQDANPLPSPPVNPESDPTATIINGIIEDTVADMSVAGPVAAPPSPTPFEVSAVTDTTAKEKDVNPEEQMTSHLAKTTREEEQMGAMNPKGEVSTPAEDEVTPKETEATPEEPTPNDSTTTIAETATTREPLAETDSSMMDTTMKDSTSDEQAANSPEPVASQGLKLDADVLPDAAPTDHPNHADECMGDSPSPASRAEQQPLRAPLFSFGGANFASTPFTQPFDFGLQQNQMPVNDCEMTTAEEAHLAEEIARHSRSDPPPHPVHTSGFAGAGQQPDNPMTYDYTGPAQSYDNSALCDLAMMVKPYSSPGQPTTITDGSAPRLDQSTEPVAMPSIPTVPTAPNDGLQGQEPASLPPIPGLQTVNIGGQPGQAADSQVGGPTTSAPTAVEDSEMLAWKDLAQIQDNHGLKTVPSVQSTAKTTTYQEPTPIIPIDPSLLPSGVVDQHEPQAGPQPEAPLVTPARKVRPLPARIRRPANLKPFEYNKDADRDHLLPKPHVAEKLPLIVDLPDGGFSGSANQTSEPQQPPPSPPKVRTSSPVKRSSAPLYDPLGKGKGKGKASIFDDPTLFEKQPSSSSFSSDSESDADFSDCEGFGSKSKPSPTNPWNFSTAALRQKSSAPKITEAPTNPSDIDVENDGIYGRDDDDSKKHDGPSSSHHPSTIVEPPQGVDHAGRRKKRSADGSGGRGRGDSRASSSLSEWSDASSSDSKGIEQRVSGLPGLGSANGASASGVPAFRQSTKAELDQGLGDLGLTWDDIYAAGREEGAAGSGNNEEQGNNRHDQDGAQDASGANCNNKNDDDDDDGEGEMPTDAEMLEAMRQNGMDSDTPADDDDDVMDHTEDNNIPTKIPATNNSTEEDDLKDLTPERKHYLDIGALTEEDKKHGREMHKLSLDAEVPCQLPCRWCREMGLDWK